MISALTLALVLFGQDSDVQFPKPGKHLQKHDHELVAKYDKFDDETMYEVQLGLLSGSGSALVKLDIDYWQNGKDRKKIDMDTEISMCFMSFTKSWKFLHQHTIIILADDRRWSFKDPHYDGSVEEDGGVSEFVWADLTTRDLLFIANSKDCDIKVGDYKMYLDASQKLAIKDYLSRLRSDPK